MHRAVAFEPTPNFEHCVVTLRPGRSLNEGGEGGGDFYSKRGKERRSMYLADEDEDAWTPRTTGRATRVNLHAHAPHIYYTVINHSRLQMLPLTSSFQVRNWSCGHYEARNRKRGECLPCHGGCFWTVSRPETKESQPYYGTSLKHRICPAGDLKQCARDSTAAKPCGQSSLPPPLESRHAAHTPTLP